MNYSTFNKDNNFNLIRLIASIFVLYNHSFILAGAMFEEPLWKRYTSMVTFGNLGVDIFFITSGFLLSLSLVTKRNPITFTVNRILRIFPGLIFSLILTVLITGIFFTSHDFTQFLQDEITKHFIISNSILLKGISYVLPGAFEKNPILSVNGSLWTLPHEVEAYITLLSLACISLTTKKYFRLTFSALLIAFCIFIYIKYITFHYEGGTDFEKYRLYFFFLLGACLGVFIEKIKLNILWAAICLIAIITLLPYKNLLLPTYTLLLPYIILALAYAPSKIIKNFNRFGDYSYGMYIYGFFVQQCIVAMIGTITPHMLFIYSLFSTLAFAIFSWHFIESPALRLKSRP